MRRSTIQTPLVGMVTIAAFVLLAIGASATQHDALLGEQCDIETRILNNNTALQDLAPILQCNINFEVTNSCTVDYDSVSTNYSNACKDAGGKIYTSDMFLDCNVTLGEQLYNGKSYYMNKPSCVGMSCTGREIEMQFDANLYPKLEEYYAARECNVRFRTAPCFNIRYW
jgi:hypothetical protein